jgi:hypothetical protein
MDTAVPSQVIHKRLKIWKKNEFSLDGTFKNFK